MNVIWHPEIQEEIDEGVDFYFERDPGVEDEFIDALETATRKLLEDPISPRKFDPPSSGWWLIASLIKSFTASRTKPFTSLP